MKQELKDIASILSTVLDFVGNEVIVDRRVAESYHASFTDAREKLDKLLAEPEPAAEPEYRMLEVGETLQAGDEVQLSGWVPILPDLVGLAVTGAGPIPVGYYRRPVANDSIISEPKLKLEVGKHYVLRNGDVVGPLEPRPNAVYYPFAFGGRCWTTDGMYNTVVQPHSLDIVSEYVPEYRILNPGEPIQAGDEISCDGESWRPVFLARAEACRRRIN